MNNVFHALVLAGCSVAGLAWADSPGKTLFTQSCSACHGENAAGIVGLAPPLDNQPLWQALGTKAPDYIVGVMLNGLSGRIVSQGMDYFSVMPPQAHLSNDDLAAIAGYVLKEVNGLSSAPDVTAVNSARTTKLTHKDLRSLRNEKFPQ